MDLWTRNYHEVQRLGRQYADSCFDYEGKRKLELTEEEQTKLLKRIKYLQEQASQFLDFKKLIPKPPLWQYNPNDKTTHASSREFKYDHLVSDKLIMDYGVQYMSL